MFTRNMGGGAVVKNPVRDILQFDNGDRLTRL